MIRQTVSRPASSSCCIAWRSWPSASGRRTPSCIRTPPEAVTGPAAGARASAVSAARVISSPTAPPRLPPMNRKSITAATTGCPADGQPGAEHRLGQAGRGPGLGQPVGVRHAVAEAQRVRRGDLAVQQAQRVRGRRAGPATPARSAGNSRRTAGRRRGCGPAVCRRRPRGSAGTAPSPVASSCRRLPLVGGARAPAAELTALASLAHVVTPESTRKRVPSVSR